MIFMKFIIYTKSILSILTSLIIFFLFLQASAVCSCNSNCKDEDSEDAKNSISTKVGVEKEIKGSIQIGGNQTTQNTKRNFTENQEKEALAGYTFNELFSFSSEKTVIYFAGNSGEEIFLDNKNYFNKINEPSPFISKFNENELNKFKNDLNNLHNPFILSPTRYSFNNNKSPFIPITASGRSELEKLQDFIPNVGKPIELSKPGYIEIKVILKRNENNQISFEYTMLGQTHTYTFYKITVSGKITNISSNLIVNDEDKYHTIEITLSEKPLCHAGGSILSLRGYQSIAQIPQDASGVGRCNGPYNMGELNSYSDNILAKIRYNFYDQFNIDKKVYFPFRIIKDKNNDIRFQTFYVFLPRYNFARQDSKSVESENYISPFGTDSVNDATIKIYQFHEDMRIAMTTSPLVLNKNILKDDFNKGHLTPINLGIQN